MRGRMISLWLVFIAAALAVSAIEAFQVTGVSVSVSEREFTGSCPHRFNFTGRITTNRAGTVSYRWVSSDGGTTAAQTLVFAAAGTQTVSTYWQLGGGMASYDDWWMKIEILEPNSRLSNPALFDLKCLMRAVLPSYEIAGAIDSGREGSKIFECQVKVILRRDGRTIQSRTVALDANGCGSYAFFGPILGSGRYVVDVEKVPNSCNPDRYNPCFNGTEPESRVVDLSAAAPRVAGQDFRVLWGLAWNSSRCW